MSLILEQQFGSGASVDLPVALDEMDAVKLLDLIFRATKLLVVLSLLLPMTFRDMEAEWLMLTLRLLSLALRDMEAEMLVELRLLPLMFCDIDAERVLLMK